MVLAPFPGGETKGQMPVVDGMDGWSQGDQAMATRRCEAYLMFRLDVSH